MNQKTPLSQIPGGHLPVIQYAARGSPMIGLRKGESPRLDWNQGLIRSLGLAEADRLE